MMKKCFCALLISTLCLQMNLGLAKQQIEVESDYLTHIHLADRYIDTVSVHVVEKFAEKHGWKAYRGVTVTRPYGHLIDDKKVQKDCSAFGIGPVYMISNEKKITGKLSDGIEVSGGVILYDKPFPAEGRYYNFMWRIQPKLVYKLNNNSSINLGWTFMHVSNGFRTHNPGYDARGVSLGLVFNY